MLNVYRLYKHRFVDEESKLTLSGWLLFYIPSSYPAKAPKKPRHVSACGFQTSFEAIVDTDADDYFATESLAYGMKVRNWN